MVAAEPREEAGREVVHGRDDGEAQPPAVDALEILERLPGIVQLRRDAPAVVQYDLPGVGQIHAAAEMFEQCEPEHVLELLHLHRDRRLGQVELFRRACVTAVARDGLEDLELAEGDVQAHVTTSAWRRADWPCAGVLPAAGRVFVGCAFTGLAGTAPRLPERTTAKRATR